MVCLVLMLAVIVIRHVHGGRLLHALPMKDGCAVVSPERQVFRVEGEAIILTFPKFVRVLQARNIAPPNAKYLITKEDGTGGVAFGGEGRVQQQDKQLWFLPAQPSDSGEYVCTYRNETYCVTGRIWLHVYESGSVDMKKLCYPIPVREGETLTLECPSLDDFNITDSPIEWYKGSSPTTSQLGNGTSFSQVKGHLIIGGVERTHAGLYTCRLKVSIRDHEYNVSRAYLLHVRYTVISTTTTTTTTTESDLSPTSNPGLINKSIHSSVSAPNISPPIIVMPLNGTIFESLHGSGLELFCKVLTECQMENVTAVTWLVNGQSVESSYIYERALQGGRRVTSVSEVCQIELRLVVLAMTEEDMKTELKCVAQNPGGRQEVITQLQLEDSTFTWLVVGVVAVLCFLTVVSVFLYVLLKPYRKKKTDYFLARQNSTF